MEVQVEITSKQIIDGEIVDSEKNICKGKIEYLKKGEILEFVEKYEEKELSFKINILKDKVVINRNGSNMILDLKNKTIATLEAQEIGFLNMKITTKKIEITREENLIRNINLEYTIELEDRMAYDNAVEIKLI